MDAKKYFVIIFNYISLLLALKNILLSFCHVVDYVLRVLCGIPHLSLMVFYRGTESLYYFSVSHSEGAII
jgi:hypothetical protein